MSLALLPRHPVLQSTSRLQALTVDDDRVRLREWLIMGLAGLAAAAASQFLDFNLRIPGHAILRAILPLTVGLALVPRRGAGAVLGAFALSSGMIFRTFGWAEAGLVSLGALTSQAATGPLLDLVLRRARSGWKLYAAFAAAGLSSNLLAFAVRGGSKLAGLDLGGRRSIVDWFLQAVATYPICGLLAGLLSGALWFYGSRKEAHNSPVQKT